MNVSLFNIELVPLWVLHGGIGSLVPVVVILFCIIIVEDGLCYKGIT